MDFKKIYDDYRAMPFWSWNEKLDTKETARQVGIMKDAGLGGYFMHARGGLETEYMGAEWFENIAAGISEGKRLEMSAWAYDENGWPSGFGNGVVNGKGVAFQQKYLRYERTSEHTDTSICSVGGYHFYYDINPFYCDTLCAEATETFLNEIYKPYYEKYKNEIEGFFTDEPQISRNGIPWSFILPEEYKKAYNEDLFSHLIELFENTGDYKDTRIKFWTLITELFSKNFMKKIYDWCDERGLKLTGHLVLEEGLEKQLTSNGAVMPHYEYFHIPGMDWLSRNEYSNLAQIQLGSVAAQLGKKRVLTESFALCGHNVSFNELKGLLEWQMVRGINLLCPHLEGYSLRGIRKRDYPPAMYYQQPWWSEYKSFIESMARIGGIIAEGKIDCDLLVIHPQSAAWTCFNNGENEGLAELESDFKNIIAALDAKHVSFHLGDEILMKRHGSAKDGKITIGNHSYSRVLIADNRALFDSTRRLLDEFTKSGGKIVTLADIENNDIIDNDSVTYTKRIFDDCIVHYFVNSNGSEQKAYIKSGAKQLDIMTGELLPFGGEHVFEPHGSLIVIEDGTSRAAKKEAFAVNALVPSGSWKIKKISENALTLDFCDYYFDGELQEKNGYVLNIQQRACNLKRPVNIKQNYHVNIDHIPESLYLVCETPDKFDIAVNGKKIAKNDCGFYRDTAFRKIDISSYAVSGRNTISFTCRFTQSDKLYENLKKAVIFESEKNKITYDTEIEPVYLVGDFSVRCDGDFINLDKDALRYSGTFTIDAPKTELSPENIEQQGYPFFCGSVTLLKKLTLDDTNYKLVFDKFGTNVIKVRVNSSEYKLLWGKNEIDISAALKKGENEIEIELTNNLRNLLGPHHLKEGECYTVCPHSFFKEPCIWSAHPEKTWNEDYCFVEFGLKFKKQ